MQVATAIAHRPKVEGKGDAAVSAPKLLSGQSSAAQGSCFAAAGGVHQEVMVGQGDGKKTQRSVQRNLGLRVERDGGQPCLLAGVAS